MTHGVLVIPRVCRSLNIDGLVYRRNVVPILATSSIEKVVFPRLVFTFMGFPINGPTWVGAFVVCSFVHHLGILLPLGACFFGISFSLSCFEVKASSIWWWNLVEAVIVGLQMPIWWRCPLLCCFTFVLPIVVEDPIEVGKSLWR